jgi:putative DNA primase/helicase
MIVLEGPQGTNKSRSLRIIGGEWFCEQHESASNPKAFAEILQGKLIVEIAELDSFGRAEVTRVKATITNVKDRYRAPYERYASDHPRQCVFVGTTNKDDWNKDDTGGRRFWPIACHGEIDIDAIRDERDQLFAEAVHRFKAGETWWEMPTAETRDEQQKRRDPDPWLDSIAEYVKDRTAVITTEILSECIKLEKGHQEKRHEMRAAACLRDLGWKGKNERVDSRVRKVWRPLNE